MTDPFKIRAVIHPQTGTTPARVRPYRLSVHQYLKMIDAGVFADDARVELLDGFLVEQMTKGVQHDYTLGQLCDLLRPLLPANTILREDKSLQLGPRSRPEPDVILVAGPASLYKHRDPNASETALVVEVADTSYLHDRGTKWMRYAAAGIQIYWIVNLNKRQVEVFGEPAGKGRSASYGTTEIFAGDATLPVVIGNVEVGRIVVQDILP